ncbi:hypothetical protein BDV25DRAFT_127477 [Aspergillus avenaceus]|uniref:Uncharacterized protein n=1 Tax=Aspergillus avenaceus TaxID=36643 RepID=A0A5N6U3J3_ASPAV|nr:hypothetical protein BDV25DRAFT_127477 [Aspergillus avenaceus]
MDCRKFQLSLMTIVLRPGEYIDQTRKLNSLVHLDSDIFDPDGLGTVNDVRNEQFYRGGTRSLTAPSISSASQPESVIYDPYPAYNSREWRKQWKGNFQPCTGPRGTDLDRTSRDDMISVYRGTQRGFPHPMFGSYEAMGLDGNVCVDRYTRLSAYGHNIPAVRGRGKISWNRVDWGNLQAQCLERNADRYKSRFDKRWLAQHPLWLSPNQAPITADRGNKHASPGMYKPRSAVLLRCWHSMPWTPNHHHYLRSLIMELSLHSGAEYEIFLLVHVQDETLPIFSDPETVQLLKETFIPSEFHNISVLFNDRLLEAWYPKVPEHSPIYQHLQPVQAFSQLYPDFDYYWQLETDARQTGHMYHFLERAVEFARQQPRKHLWERNAYFYTPGAHGSWEEFVSMVNESMRGRESIWGPVLEDESEPRGPKPPVKSPQLDDHEWGVGEEADLITFLPIFDPAQTSWTFPNVLFNIPKDVPRRASPITMWRVSKTLLDIMHADQAVNGVGLGSEMSAPTWALWHGLKAVHVPHPIYVDGQWTPQELGRPDSIWNWDHVHDHIMYRTTYMFTTQTAEDLYRRWLGFPAESAEDIDPAPHTDERGRFWFDGGDLREDLYGRLCFPPIFLHTIKNSDREKGPAAPVPI